MHSEEDRPEAGPADSEGSEARARERAQNSPAEEARGGRADPVAQAEAVLADSDARQMGREGSGAEVEHRTPEGDR